MSSTLAQCPARTSHSKEANMTTEESAIHIDPTADVDPTVILRGNITIGAWTTIGPGTVLTGNITIGDHTLVQCNVVIRGNNRIGSYVHIYDLVCIEGGRPARVGGSLASEPDRSIIGDCCWINHGSTMHGSQLGDGAVLGLNVALDYNCRIGKGALITDGSACRVDTVVPENCMAEGVPARIVKTDITDDDRRAVMGLLPDTWVHYAGAQQEQAIRRKKGL
jgi:carbonic anhydrase/acetyltransferase-like protein (isoleucine patch superfamily)